MSQQADLTTDDVVAAILTAFEMGMTSPDEERAIHFDKAVNALRLAVLNSQQLISEGQRRQLDSAILLAQPFIVRGENVADLRFMAGGLHVITAHLADPDRPEIGEAKTVVVEALCLARMLENHLNSAAILAMLRRRRSTMNEAELLAMRTVVDTFYPLPDIGAATQLTTLH